MISAYLARGAELQNWAIVTLIALPNNTRPGAHTTSDRCACVTAIDSCGGTIESIAIGPAADYLRVMATHAYRTTKSSSTHGSSKSRSTLSGRFLSVASLKPVTKRATITSAQADKVVKDYLDLHAK